jgi:hypothetical protein
MGGGSFRELLLGQGWKIANISEIATLEMAKTSLASGRSAQCSLTPIGRNAAI